MTDQLHGESHGSHSGGGESSPQKRLESAKSHAQRAAEDLKAAAEAKVTEFKGQAENVWNEARGRATSFQEEGEAYIKANPTKSVLYELVVCVILGLFLRR